MLMAEAERAAASIEYLAAHDQHTMASLLETRRLLNEAREAVERAEAGESSSSSSSSEEEDNELEAAASAGQVGPSGSATGISRMGGLGGSMWSVQGQQGAGPAHPSEDDSSDAGIGMANGALKRWEDQLATVHPDAAAAAAAAAGAAAAASLPAGTAESMFWMQRELLMEEDENGYSAGWGGLVMDGVMGGREVLGGGSGSLGGPAGFVPYANGSSLPRAAIAVERWEDVEGAGPEAVGEYTGHGEELVEDEEDEVEEGQGPVFLDRSGGSSSTSLDRQQQLADAEEEAGAVGSAGHFDFDSWILFQTGDKPLPPPLASSAPPPPPPVQSAPPTESSVRRYYHLFGSDLGLGHRGRSQGGGSNGAGRGPEDSRPPRFEDLGRRLGLPEEPGQNGALAQFEAAHDAYVRTVKLGARLGTSKCQPPDAARSQGTDDLSVEPATSGAVPRAQLPPENGAAAAAAAGYSTAGPLATVGRGVEDAGGFDAAAKKGSPTTGTRAGRRKKGVVDEHEESAQRQRQLQELLLEQQQPLPGRRRQPAATGQSESPDIVSSGHTADVHGRRRAVGRGKEQKGVVNGRDLLADGGGLSGGMTGLALPGRPAGGEVHGYNNEGLYTLEGTLLDSAADAGTTMACSPSPSSSRPQSRSRDGGASEPAATDVRGAGSRQKRKMASGGYTDARHDHGSSSSSGSTGESLEQHFWDDVGSGGDSVSSSSLSKGRGDGQVGRGGRAALLGRSTGDAAPLGAASEHFSRLQHVEDEARDKDEEEDESEDETGRRFHGSDDGTQGLKWPGNGTASQGRRLSSAGRGGGTGRQSALLVASSNDSGGGLVGEEAPSSAMVGVGGMWGTMGGLDMDDVAYIEAAAARSARSVRGLGRGRRGGVGERQGLGVQQDVELGLQAVDLTGSGHGGVDGWAPKKWVRGRLVASEDDA